MAKKKNTEIKNALTLKPKGIVPKRPVINNQEIEKATSEIHEEEVKPKKEKEEVKKTSIHIPMELYRKLKRESFDKGITLRKLIIDILESKV
ncbi:hypothetical protein [Aureispira sp. CCB-QB1]|uniref:hypothetical protein n=1 Tax=Aureispira sp. CCB-QB1 TaxID=1313421 RepID=UPI000697841D|nr:hypothetical protein [Aureispira sp. CCB-QB1]